MLHASKGEAQLLEFVMSLKGMSGIPVPSCRWLSSEVCWMGHCSPCHPSLPRAGLGGCSSGTGAPLELPGQGTELNAGQSLPLWRTCPAGLFFIPGLFSVLSLTR